MMSQQTFTVALLQSQARSDRPAERLTRLDAAAAQAARNRADLLVTPELYMSGYNVGPAVRECAEPQDGPFVSEAAEIARRHRVALVIGYPERASDAVYNACAVIDDKGALLGSYRKVHLSRQYEKKTFATGEDFQLYELAGLKVAPLICYDVEFPEPVRDRALAGADLIVVPTALRKRYAHVARLTVPARAFENGVFIAYANHAGREGDWNYCGLSCLAAPDGHFLAQAEDGEEIILATIDPEKIIEARRDIPYLRERRPEIYRI